MRWNAVEYGAPGGSRRAASQPVGDAVTSVVDTGSGAVGVLAPEPLDVLGALVRVEFGFGAFVRVELEWGALVVLVGELVLGALVTVASGDGVRVGDPVPRGTGAVLVDVGDPVDVVGFPPVAAGAVAEAVGTGWAPTVAQ